MEEQGRRAGVQDMRSSGRREEEEDCHKDIQKAGREFGRQEAGGWVGRECREEGAEAGVESEVGRGQSDCGCDSM